MYISLSVDQKERRYKVAVCIYIHVLNQKERSYKFAESIYHEVFNERSYKVTVCIYHDMFIKRKEVIKLRYVYIIPYS